MTREAPVKPTAGEETRVSPRATVLGPLLVATDGLEGADEALRAAKAIAKRTGQRIEVLAVHEPIPLLASEVQLAQGPDADAESRAGLRVRVLEQLMRIDASGRWPVEVVTGQPALVIARAAQRLGASMVLMGLGEHGLYERLLGDEMVLRVIRLGTVPVLAVAPGFLALPTRVLAATDFSESSVRAVRLAESLMHERGTLSLVHVVAPDMGTSNWKRVNAPYQGTLGRAFDLIVASLPRRDVTVLRELIGGEPATALLNQAEHTQADLVVTGSHGHGFLTRLWLGSVSQRLVRGARCSVLVAPPADLPSYEDELPGVTTRFEAYEWAERLEEFTRRNRGRRATTEVIDADFGAQIENREMPFRGADFDPRDASIHLMFGDDVDQAQHLTRTIRDAYAVQVLRESHGQDLMLRVAHGTGQTLVTLER